MYAPRGRYRRKRSPDRGDEEARTLRSIPEGITESGANGRPVRDCAPRRGTGIVRLAS